LERIKIENISKQYRLGEVGTGTISHDLNRWWHKIRGKDDPYKLITETNDRTKNGDSNYVWALKDINFSVKEGEVIGIIGKNGAGKSTLLKILSKVTGPSKGRILINGRIGALLEVGTGMNEELTGKENIFLNGAILGMTKKEIKSKFDEIVEFSGITKYIDTPFKRYSSGMRVRLGFAVAAFLEPEILIVDEVLAVGDADFQKRAIGKMQEVSKGEGRTVLFVSHNMGSIKSLCNRSILLEKGEIVFNGETNECINKYLNNSKLESGTKLCSIKHRNGNGKLRFSDYSLYNRDNEPISDVISGEFVKISVKFNVLDNIDFKKLIIAVNLKDNFDNAIISFVSDEMGINFNSPIENILDIEIPKLMLRGGRYNIRLLAMYGDTQKENFLDEIDNAFVLNVLSSDYWNSGKTLRIGESAFMNGKMKII
jgi:lipopolysaccharide transport system ATP-binding protein